MKKLFLYLLPVFWVLIFGNNINAQISAIKKIEGTTKKQAWEKITSDPQIKVLIKELSKKGFSALDPEKYFSGYNATVIQKGGKKEAFIYAFDFKKKGYMGLASIVWRQVGMESYKAYLIFPEIKEKIAKDDTAKLIDLAIMQAYENAEEYFVTENNTIEKVIAQDDENAKDHILIQNNETAGSRAWRKCFRRCISRGDALIEVGSTKVRTNCKMNCLAAVAVCGGTMAIMAAAGAIPTAGFSVGIAVGVFFACAGASCSVCFVACGIGCP